MATLIPSPPDLPPVSVPSPRNAIELTRCFFPGAQFPLSVRTSDGSEWWYRDDPYTQEAPNPRATAWCRIEPSQKPPFRGEVLYLSADEARLLRGG